MMKCTRKLSLLEASALPSASHEKRTGTRQVVHPIAPKKDARLNNVPGQACYRRPEPKS